MGSEMCIRDSSLFAFMQILIGLVMLVLGLWLSFVGQPYQLFESLETICLDSIVEERRAESVVSIIRRIQNVFETLLKISMVFGALIIFLGFFWLPMAERQKEKNKNA